MTKKLVIRFVKFERALVAQQIGKVEGFRGIGNDTSHILVGDYFLSFQKDTVYLETRERGMVDVVSF